MFCYFHLEAEGKQAGAVTKIHVDGLHNAPDEVPVCQECLDDLRGMKPEPYDQLRDDRATDAEEDNRPGPGDPACRECGDLAEYPREGLPEYCQACWNGQLRRSQARRLAV
jgi:hypothetical protein